MSTNPYDPVTTTDSTQLADDDWGLNLPRIRYKSYGDSRFKGICNFLKERFRLIMIIGVIVVIGIVLISIIAVATHQTSGRKPSPKDKDKRWALTDEGLMFYPIPKDGSTVISFSGDDTEDTVLLKSLDNVTEEYRHQNQFKEVYMDCTANTNPPDRTCKLVDIHFGDVCTTYKGWGYRHAMPCVFLQLNLPENVTIRPISRESLLWPVAELVMENHNDSSYVPVYCQGTTHQDRLILGVQGFDKGDYHPIQYYPRDGLPSFFYRQRNMSLPFVKPAMMIHVTSLKDNLMVHITCTAWGQLYDYNDNMIDHELLKTSFGLYMNPK